MNEQGETNSGQGKPSRFNEYISIAADRYVVYNNLSGALITVPAAIAQSLQQNEIPAVSPDGENTLRQAGFIVDTAADEIAGLHANKEALESHHQSVSFQILPTLNCNFRCTYCYQRTAHHSGTMGEAVMDAIYATIDAEILPTTTHLNIGWFGGEPLLALPVIQRLSERILRRIAGTGIEYFSPLITNGYLLDEKAIEILQQCRIGHLQVTLDGLAPIHDQRRTLVNGQGTFAQIYENIQRIVRHKIPLSIRINLDRDNIAAVPALLARLAADGINRHARIGIGAVTRFNSVCESVSDCLLDQDELETFFSNPEIERLARDPATLLRAVPNYLGCVATAGRSLIIGPGGELYKCSKTIGQAEEQCGNITATDYSHPNILKWVRCSRFDRRQCRRCSMIPICGGDGCAYHYVMKGKQDGHCDPLKMKSTHHDHIVRLYQTNSPRETNQ